MTKRRVVVAGGGNAALAVAGDLAGAGHAVRLLEHPAAPAQLRPVLEQGRITVHGRGRGAVAPIEWIGCDAAEALDGAEALFVAVPAFAHRVFAELTVPHLRPDQTVIVFTGALGGLEWIQAARRHPGGQRFTVVETHTLPYAARITGPGEVTILSDVPWVQAAAFPAGDRARAEACLGHFYPQVQFGPNLLAPALCNVNGAIHPVVVLLNLPRIDRARGQPWWIWEEGVSESVARVIERLDEERLALARAFGLELPDVAELQWRSGYGPRGSIYESLNGCAALRRIRGPESLDHRFISEDIPYALLPWAELAAIAGVAAPLMNAMIDLGSAATGLDFRTRGRHLAALGLRQSGAAALLEYLENGVAA